MSPFIQQTVKLASRRDGRATGAIGFASVETFSVAALQLIKANPMSLADPTTLDKT